MSSLKLGKILGISLELHSTFLLMILFVIVFLSIFYPQNLFPNLVLLFFLFISVFIHELFHSVVAVTRGIKVSKITLLPIGGLSMTEEMPEKPFDELVIALAGPFFNFIIVVLVLVLAQFFPSAWPQQIFSGVEISPEQLSSIIAMYPLFTLFWVNFMLGAFNLFVPALPLDGGRVLRALLATKLGFSRATRISAGISKIISALMFVIGFFIGNFFLSIIGVFVFLGAGQETEFVLIKEVFRDMTAKNAATKKALKIKPESTVEEALAKMLQKKQTVLVVDTAAPSFVSVEMLEKTRKDERNFAKISEIAKAMPAIKPDTPLEKAFAFMLSTNAPVLVVNEKKKAIGFVFEEDLQKLLRIKKAEKQLN